MVREYPLNLVEDIFGDKTDVIAKELEEQVKELDSRETEVIIARYKEGKTLKQTGEDMGVTSERIRQIQARAIRRLRHPSRLNEFKAYTYEELTSNYAEFIRTLEENQKLKAALQLKIGWAGDEETLNKLAETVSVMNTKLERLNMSRRLYMALYRSGYRYIGDVISQPKEEIKKIRNLGKKSYEELVQTLRGLGIDMRNWED